MTWHEALKEWLLYAQFGLLDQVQTNKKIKVVREVRTAFPGIKKIPMQISPLAPAEMHTTAPEDVLKLRNFENWVMNLWGPIQD